ncbi:HisA/HisF-related TIM barrel protein [Winogradskyella sp.]|nr:HisA/HisF-related TIM barrel protein [Winogradskyella sp.]
MKQRIRVIPVLTILNNKLVKTVQFKNPAYIGDPINTVKIFNEKYVDEIILTDIGISKKKYSEISFDRIRNIASEAFMPMAYGGGINCLEDADKVFDCGFEKVILNTAAFNNVHLVEQISTKYGAQSVCVSLDIKKNMFGNHRCYSNSGKKTVKGTLSSSLLTFQNAGAGEIMITSISRDGTWEGYDLDILSHFSEDFKLPIIINGGAGSIQHLQDAVDYKYISAIAASSLFIFQKKGAGVLINIPKTTFFKEND